MKFGIFRIVLNIDLTYKSSIKQLDVNNNFLNETLPKKVYIKQVPRIIDHDYPDFVCKLENFLYGLK